ncbi:MAG: DUF1631 family protein [Rhodanobacter sp.]|nr:MAG: DUF1631 family protein [Rhodanobacter sp.]TAM13358.1 MAG: DUF1631 family protein [Rhodanobacter sp.]TAM35083.1 MAG: DUF1631 family protein [Rhodanobacter sp.]
MDAEHQYRGTSTSAVVGARRWPARTQQLLGTVAPLCAQWLEPALRRCLERFDEELYQRAERSHGHQDQQQCFDTRALLKQQRAAFMKAFADAVRGDFLHLGKPAETAEESLENQPLRLLERGEQELAATLSKLAARGEARHRALLAQLAYRYAVLVAMPPLEGAALPVGPDSLAAALRAAMGTVELPQTHRLMLIQTFEKAVLGEIGTLYERINDTLSGAGLLPQLRPYASVRVTSGGHATAWGGSGQAPGEDALGEEAMPAAATEGPAFGGVTSPAGAAAPISVMENLRELLAERRLGVGTGGGGQSATTDELQSALGALQEHLAQVTGQASRELRSAQRLRDELLLQLNANKPADAAPTRLSPEQDNTVELMAMLFEQLGQHMQHGPHAQSVLSGLQLPMLRLAVSDHEFLEQREHPGRQLLNAVAEAANDWLDGPDGDTDRQLTDRLQQLVQRAQKEPPTAGLYTSLLADIEHQLTALNRRVQAAERRHVEAMQGRERLDQARQRARELLAERFTDNPPRGLLRALLDRAWSDVLSLTLLQHGEDGEAFQQRLHVTDQLLGREAVTDAAWLRREVQAGLQQIGMDSEEASQVAQRLVGDEAGAAPAAANAAPAAPRPAPTPTTPAVPPAAAMATRQVDPPATSTKTPARAPVTPPAPAAARAPAAAAPSSTDLAMRLKQRKRLGESAASAPDDDSERPLGPQEARVYNRLRQLPFGTWFEFHDDQTGEAVQRKLAWFSSVTGNSLFVTRRGGRGEEMNLRELARGIVYGQVREVPGRREGLLDRAWHSLAGSLRQGEERRTTGVRP